MLKDFARVEDGLGKDERKAETERFQKGLSALQQRLRDAKLPVIVLVEGWDSAGKGSLINDLISELDPRFASVFCADSALKNAERYPFLYPYFCAIPENGKLLFMDKGWMDETVRQQLHGKLKDGDYARRIESVKCFERQLRDNGYLLLKLFVDISRQEQRERMEELRKDKNTAWRVTEEDLRQNEEYQDYRDAYDDFMTATNDTPWYILDGHKHKLLCYDAFKLIFTTVDAALKGGKYNAPAFEEAFPMSDPIPRLEDADLTAELDDETYKKELKHLQKRVTELHNEIYRRRIPVVVCYEGWDAAGKGGNIRRLAYPLDPRGFTVYPIASPEPHELARHYLWRFWTRLPRSGHISIFDRTWYGRVMVERIEGYCSENDWQRAYNEINEFEQELHRWGAVVLKFWIQIDSDTQLRRFTDRQNTPEKQWKITDEDWRNREKWPQYYQAVSEMLEKTSTEYAPWHIIESVDKKYARVKVLRLVAETLEKALEEREK